MRNELKRSMPNARAGRERRAGIREYGPGMDAPEHTLGLEMEFLAFETSWRLVVMGLRSLRLSN